MTAQPITRLVRMANQIAASVPAASDEARATLAAAHMARFWSPLMKQRILACDCAANAALAGPARTAVQMLREQLSNPG